MRAMGRPAGHRSVHACRALQQQLRVVGAQQAATVDRAAASIQQAATILQAPPRGLPPPPSPPPLPAPPVTCQYYRPNGTMQCR